MFKKLITLVLFSFLLSMNAQAGSYKPGVVLTFDDYFVDQWHDFFAARTDVKATFFASHWHTYSNGMIEKLRELEANGHEIGYHTHDHKGIASHYHSDPNRIQEYLNEQIIPGLNRMKADGFNPVSFSFPFGEHTDAYDDALNVYFPYLRTTFADVNKPLSELDELYHNEATNYSYLSGDGIDISYDNDIAEIEAALTRAKTNGEILTLYAHEIIADSSPEAGDYAIRVSKLNQVINKAKQLGLKFYTFKEAYQAGNKGAVTTTIVENKVQMTWSGFTHDFVGIVPVEENNWEAGMPSVVTDGNVSGSTEVTVPNPFNQQQYVAIFYKDTIKVFTTEPFLILNTAVIPLPPEIISPIGVSSHQGNAFALSWKAVPGASSYDYTGYETDVNEVINWNNSFFDNNVTAEEAGCANGGVCHITDNVTTQYGAWSVRANLGSISSDYSDYIYFSKDIGTTPDTTPPVITLAGVNPVSMTVDTTYVDAGATATDNVDPTVNVTINATAVNTAIAGTYTVQYTATDLAGNTATTTRTVIVSTDTTPDTTPPVITLAGANPVSITTGTTYVDAGATATDNVDSTVNVVIDASAVNTSVAGTYTVTYTATDLAGNKATATRRVIVTNDSLPLHPPVAIFPVDGSISPSKQVELSWNAVAGATSYNYEGRKTSKKGDINWSRYIFDTEISAEAAGCTTGGICRVTQNISVSYAVWSLRANRGDKKSEYTDYIHFSINTSGPDTTAPVITLTGSNPVTIQTGTNYTDAGAAATDNVDPTVTVIVDASAVNTAIAGSYTVQFTATDLAGNIANATRSVIVSTEPTPDTMPPIITVTGLNPVSITTGTVYVDAGATATDNVDPVISVIKDASAVNTAVAGTYTVKFTATDSAGNVATATRRVIVTNDSLPLHPPVAIFPVDGSISPSKQVELSWNAVAGATSYNYEGRKTSKKGDINWSRYIFDTEISAEAAGCATGGICRVTQNISVSYAVWSLRANLGDKNSDYTDYIHFSINTSGPDTTAPVITLTGSNPVTIQTGTNYTDAGATATDNVDPSVDVIMDASAVNTAVAGTYTVNFTATDLAGNKATASRTVIVSSEPILDTTPPIITLTGLNPVTIQTGVSYIDAGATATDNSDPSVDVVIDASAVNTAVAGTYAVTLTATDLAGNKATASRQVIVSSDSLPLQAPVVIFPVDGSTSQSKRVELSWNAVVGATSYDFEGYETKVNGDIIWNQYIFETHISAEAAGCFNGGICRTRVNTTVSSAAWTIRTNRGDKSSEYTDYIYFSITGTNPSQPIRIMPLGDSITEGVDGRPSYRRALWHKLQHAGYNVDFVGNTTNNNSPLEDFDLDHEGHSGWEAGELDAKITEWMSTINPDIVMLHIGTNDLTNGQDDESTLLEIDGIISKLRANNSEVVILLAKIIPMRHYDTATFNGKIDAFVASRNTTASPIVIVDQYTGYDPQVDSFDKYHPDTSGEEKMATNWFEALRDFLPVAI